MDHNNSNAKPVKSIIYEVPCYKREYVLPITSAIQSKDSWKWPPPERPDFSLLDRLLNSTTLSTQCLTHKHVLKCGENAHEELTDDLKRRISEIETMQKNFVQIVSEEVRKVKAEMESRYKKLMNEYLQEQQVHMTGNWDQKLAAMIELENEKVQRLDVEWQLRMEDALAKQREDLERENGAKLQAAIDSARIEVNEDIEKRMAEVLQKQVDLLEGGFRERLARKIEEVNARHREEMEQMRGDLISQHEEEMANLKSKWTQMCERYNQLLEFSRNVERDYFLLQEDFRRFIDNVKGVGGHFGSSYLMRSKQHGLLVMQSPETQPQISIENTPDFNELEKRASSRQLNLTDLAAAPSDPNFWPDNVSPPILKEKQSGKEPVTFNQKTVPVKKDTFIPVKLVRPLDSDDIGNVILPVRQPEKSGASFVLSFSDVY